MSARAVLAAFVTAGLALVSAICFEERSSPDRAQHERFVQLLADRHGLDQDLARQALESRFAFQSNYDALTRGDREVRGLEASSRESIPAFVRATERAELEQALRDYDRVCAHRGQLLERFKSENALFRNSVGFFPSAVTAALAGARDAALVEPINELSGLTLGLALKDDTLRNQTQGQAIDALVAMTRGRLSDAGQRPVELMLAHARAIARHKSGTDGLLERLLALPINERHKVVSKSYDQAFARAEGWSRLFGRCVSGLALVLLAIVAYAGLRLQRAAAGLGRSNERLEVAVQARTAELESEMLRRTHVELELRQAQKLEAVGQLASGIAHEINTPIQYVGDSIYFLRGAFGDMMRLLDAYRAAVSQLDTQSMAALSACQDDVDFDFLRVEVPEAIERTADGARQVTSIVQAMKTFAHVSAEKAPVDLNAAIDNTLTVARNEYKYVAELELELGVLPDVTCNAGGIRQVLLNLVVNAAHAIGDKNDGSGERGTIRIRTQLCGEHVLIAIADTGAGIPEAIRGRVFDPFFTTKEPGRGTGQGLAISQRIVAQHGGRLWFETELGLGTTFLLQLPIVGSEAHDSVLAA